MGTPGDKIPLDKIVEGTEAGCTQTSVSIPPEMTILTSIPALGIFLEQATPEDPKALPLLSDIENELLVPETSQSLDEILQTAVPEELNVPGPSGLQKKSSKRLKKSQTIKKTSQHQSSGTFKCENCKKTFSSKFKLVRHVLIHSDRKPFSCTVCDRTFHRKDHLKNHIKVHSPCKKVYKCERASCRKEYTSAMSFRKHLALHAAQDGALDCKICSKVFESQADILYHLKVHAGSRTVKSPNEKKFTCDHCDRRFFTRKDVRRHLVVHTGTRNFLCQFCPQRFGRKDHLVRHINKSHGLSKISFESVKIEQTTEQEELESEDKDVETDLDKIESILDYPIVKEESKLEISEVENLLFPAFSELNPLLCSETEGLPFIGAGSSSTPLPSTGTDILPSLDQSLGTGMLDVPVIGELPTDVLMENDLLRLISESGDQLRRDDDSLPLPGFSQAFQQPPS